MKVKVIYENKKDKELIELVRFSTPFFVEYIDATTKNGKKESYRIKSPFAAKMNPFIVVYDDEDNFVSAFYSEKSNACQQFIDLYK